LADTSKRPALELNIAGATWSSDVIRINDNLIMYRGNPYNYLTRVFEQAATLRSFDDWGNCSVYVNFEPPPEKNF
jgi:hypothetical protein